PRWIVSDICGADGGRRHFTEVSTMSSTNAPVVLVTEGSDPRPPEWLHQHCQVVEITAADPQFYHHLSSATGLVVRTYTRVNEELLSKAHFLRVVGRGGVC